MDAFTLSLKSNITEFVPRDMWLVDTKSLCFIPVLFRFSVFVKSGGESFLLGATTAENKSIMANDVALIVVSLDTSSCVRC